jgi:hypothetical protein
MSQRAAHAPLAAVTPEQSGGYRACPQEGQWPFLPQIAGCSRLVKNLAPGAAREVQPLRQGASATKDSAELRTLKEAVPTRGAASLSPAGTGRPARRVRPVLRRAIGLPQAARHIQSAILSPPRCEANHDRAVRRWDMGKLRPGKCRGDHSPLLDRLHRSIVGKVRSITVSLAADRCRVSFWSSKTWQHGAVLMAPRLAWIACR